MVLLGDIKAYLVQNFVSPKDQAGGTHFSSVIASKIFGGRLPQTWG